MRLLSTLLYWFDLDNRNVVQFLWILGIPWTLRQQCEAHKCVLTEASYFHKCPLKGLSHCMWVGTHSSVSVCVLTWGCSDLQTIDYVHNLAKPNYNINILSEGQTDETRLQLLFPPWWTSSNVASSQQGNTSRLWYLSSLWFWPQSHSNCFPSVYNVGKMQVILSEWYNTAFTSHLKM